jgi:hypothetical protein
MSLPSALRAPGAVQRARAESAPEPEDEAVGYAAIFNQERAHFAAHYRTYKGKSYKNFEIGNFSFGHVMYVDKRGEVHHLDIPPDVSGSPIAMHEVGTLKKGDRYYTKEDEVDEKLHIDSKDVVVFETHMYCSEAKTLNHIYKAMTELAFDVPRRVEIVLYTEHAPCPICRKYRIPSVGPGVGFKVRYLRWFASDYKEKTGWEMDATEISEGTRWYVHVMQEATILVPKGRQ